MKEYFETGGGGAFQGFTPKPLNLVHAGTVSGGSTSSALSLCLLPAEKFFTQSSVTASSTFGVRVRGGGASRGRGGGGGGGGR